ncbi:hypothetical protein BKI52_16340 [marine bacterium AO1-C]|nr:hypothetical protein BKI52_16340 [marine bacterium AO1-C]
MKKLLMFVTMSVLLWACGGGGTTTTTTDETATKDSSAPPVKKEDKNAYSPEKADKLIKEMKACEKTVCDATLALTELGPKVGPKLEEIAANATLSKEERRKAFFVLDEIGAFEGGQKLLEAAKKGAEDEMRRRLFKTAVRTENEAVITDLLDYYISDEVLKNKDKYLHLDIASAFSGASSRPKIGSKVMAWVKKNYSTKNESYYTSLIGRSATKEDVSFLAKSLENSKNLKAKFNLAATLVELGEKKYIQVLIDGMSTGDQYSKDSAARNFAKVVEDCPADQKTKVIALIKKIKAANVLAPLGIKGRVFDEALKKLEK